jgi:hypothetical protein
MDFEASIDVDSAQIRRFKLVEWATKLRENESMSAQKAPQSTAVLVRG